MKRMLSWAMLLIAIGLSASAGIVTYEGREYLGAYFEAKQSKLVLADEASVDSMLTVIDSVTYELDSVRDINIIVFSRVDSLTVKCDSITKLNATLRQVNINLTNIVKHQNYMLDKLIAGTPNKKNAYVSQPDWPSLTSNYLYIYPTNFKSVTAVSQPDWPTDSTQLTI